MWNSRLKTWVPSFTFPTPVLLLFFLFSPLAHASSSSSPILLSYSPCFFFFFPCSSLLQLVLLLLLHLFCFFRSAFSKKVFGFGTSSFIFGSSFSSSSSFFFFYKTWFLKTWIPCGKNITMSAIRTWVFKAQFLPRTRASKAWDVIFLNSFQFVLTNYVVWQTYATLQITLGKVVVKKKWWPNSTFWQNMWWFTTISEIYRDLPIFRNFEFLKLKFLMKLTWVPKYW